MNAPVRMAMFLGAGAVFAALLAWGMWGLPAFGDYRGPYGDVINAVGVPERHMTNMASAVNFDYRGFDTLGEEYILFAAVAGLALLLRQARGEITDEPREAASDRKVSRRSDAVRWLALVLVGLTNLFGLYIVAHAHLTPGGGFQGGVILGTACMLVYLAVGYRAYGSVSPKWLMDVADAAGAGGYALVGLATMAASGIFLYNALPYGKTGSLFSAGTVPIINCCVGLEVAGSFILMFAEFLKDTRKPSEKKSA